MLKQEYGKAQISSVITKLLDDSRWFKVEPLPHDTYLVYVKAEKPLPEPLGWKGLPFEDWICLVDRHFVGGLTEEGRDDFMKYFLRGLSPSEAIYQDQKNQDI